MRPIRAKAPPINADARLICAAFVPSSAEARAIRRIMHPRTKVKAPRVALGLTSVVATSEQTVPKAFWEHI